MPRRFALGTGRGARGTARSSNVPITGQQPGPVVPECRHEEELVEFEPTGHVYVTDCHKMVLGPAAGIASVVDFESLQGGDWWQI